jgi:hypothetical protein
MMVTFFATLAGGVLAIAGGLVAVFASDRRERSRWRRDAQLKVGTDFLSALQVLTRRTIELAHLTNKLQGEDTGLALSAYREATIGWNSAIYAALLVSPPKAAGLVADLDREIDRLKEQALAKQWSRDDFREERRLLGRLAAEYLNVLRGEVGWSPLALESVWTWDIGTPSNA